MKTPSLIFPCFYVASRPIQSHSFYFRIVQAWQQVGNWALTYYNDARLVPAPRVPPDAFRIHRGHERNAQAIAAMKAETR